MRKVSIVGLGYVGLPLACLCAKKDYFVYGIDIDEKKIASLSSGKSPLQDEFVESLLGEVSQNMRFTHSFEEGISDSDVVIVCVPTPVDDDHIPDLTPLTSAIEAVGSLLKKGSILVVESTIFPGTVEDIVVPILEKHGKKPLQDDVLVAHCPERIDPGNKKWTVENLPRVVGGVTEKATNEAGLFYESIIDAGVTRLSSIKAAEATKIMENTFRDVNIAFVNEMAKSFDKAGIDILEVIRGASSKPFAFMPHYPGAGVGGHCIPVDPYYLIEKAKKIGFSHRFLSLAREINNSMPGYAVELLEKSLDENGRKLEGAKVGVLGLAYKKDVDDMRESPAVDVIKVLREKKAIVHTFDPFVLEHSTETRYEDVLDKVECLILVTDHSMFVNTEPSLFAKHGVHTIIDGRNCLGRDAIVAAGIIYRGIGRS